MEARMKAMEEVTKRQRKEHGGVTTHTYVSMPVESVEEVKAWDEWVTGREVRACPSMLLDAGIVVSSSQHAS